MNIMFSVTAYLYGDYEGHSYPVGIYSTYALALQAAKAEIKQRGGKYDCMIYQFKLDCGRDKDFKKHCTIEAYTLEESYINRWNY